MKKWLQNQKIAHAYLKHLQFVQFMTWFSKELIPWYLWSPSGAWAFDELRRYQHRNSWFNYIQRNLLFWKIYFDIWKIYFWTLYGSIIYQISFKRAFLTIKSVSCRRAGFRQSRLLYSWPLFCSRACLSPWGWIEQIPWLGRVKDEPQNSDHGQDEPQRNYFMLSGSLRRSISAYIVIQLDV